MSLEAESREAVFKELARRGIAAIRVEQAKGNAKLRKAPPKESGRRAGVVKGALAGIIVVVAAVGAWFFLAKRDGARSAAEPEKASKIVGKAPSPAPTAKVDEPEQEKPKPLRKWEYPVERTNELSSAELRKWKAHHMPPPAYTNNSALYESRLPYEIFDHPSENKIAFYLVHKPGEGLVGTPTFGKRFVNDFMQSLVNPIVVTKDDTPEQAQLKRDMIQVKIELKERIDAGEDLAAIMLDTHKEYQKLAQYKNAIEKELRDFRKRPDVTVSDVDDFVAAANQLLEGKGIAPISLSPIARRMLMRRSGNVGK